MPVMVSKRHGIFNGLFRFCAMAVPTHGRREDAKPAALSIFKVGLDSAQPRCVFYAALSRPPLSHARYVAPSAARRSRSLPHPMATMCVWGCMVK